MKGKDLFWVGGLGGWGGGGQGGEHDGKVLKRLRMLLLSNRRRGVGRGKT